MNKEIINYCPTVVIANGIMDAGGTETLILEMLRNSSGRVNYIMLIHYMGHITEGVFDAEIRELGIPIVYIPSVGTVGIRGYIREFQKVMKKMGHVDIIHSNLNANGGVIAMAAKKAGIKHRICHCHADICYKGGFLHRMKEEAQLMLLKLLIAKYATDRWACSDAAWHRLFFGHRNKVVIHNMIDVSKYLSTPEKCKAAKKVWNVEGVMVLGSVGRVAPIKNYELAIHVTADMNKNRDTHFICFGRFNEKDPYCAGLLSLADSLGITDKIHFVGNSNQVSSDIHCIDVFLMPSTTEGFGMAAIEAQASGIPTLLSDGVPQIVDVGVGLAHFFPANDASVWVQFIEDGLSDSVVSAEDIVRHFDEKGFNSKTATLAIENKYIQILNKQ